MNTRSFSYLLSAAPLFLGLLLVPVLPVFAWSIEPLAATEPEGTVIQFTIRMDKDDWVKPDQAAINTCANIGISATFVARFGLERVDGSAEFGLSETSRDLHLEYKGVPKGDLDILWCITGPAGSLQSDPHVTVHLHEDGESEPTENAALRFYELSLSGTKNLISLITISIRDFEGETNDNECSTTPISDEDPQATGSLTGSDCDDSPRGARYLADVFTYEGSQGDKLPVHVEWDGVDGYVYLEAPDGTIEAQNDDFENSSNSHIEVPLQQTGTYKIWVTTKEEGDTGDYEISLTSNEREPEADWRIESAQANPTVLSRNDELSISVIGKKNGSFTFFAAGRADVVYLLSDDAEISEADTVLGSSSHCCASNFDNVWRGALDVPPGTYWAGACITNEDADLTNNCSAGTRITVEGATSCNTRALVCGESLAGQLDDAACTEGPQGPDFRAERFTYTGEAGETIWLDADWSFDGYLVLEDPSGRIIGENDNYLGADDSRIEQTLAEGGTYTVWATSFEPGVAGTYELSIDCDSPGGPDLVVDTPEVPASILNPGHGMQVITRLHNAGDDTADGTTLRYVLSSDAHIDGQDPEIGAGGTAGMAPGTFLTSTRELIAPVTPGTYWLGACADPVADEAAVSNNCSSGRRIDIRPHPQCTSRVAACGQPVSGNLNNQDCSGSPRGIGFLAEIVEVDAEAGGSLVANAHWSGFDGYLVLEDPAGEVVAFNDDGNGHLNSRIEYAVEQAGTHRLWVTGRERGAAGTYDLELVCGTGTEPDLVASAVMLSASEVGVEDSVSLSASVDNSGNGASAAGKVHFLISPDEVISTDDTVLASLDLGALAPGATADVEVSVTTPATAGNYWVGICVDAADGETLIANNCSSAGGAGDSSPESSGGSDKSRPEAAGNAGTLLSVSAGAFCTSSAMTCGQRRSGALGADDCDQGPRGAGYAADGFTFTGDAGERVSLTVDWSGLDGYLYLEDPNGEVAAENDDFQGAGRSRIEHVLQHSGTYQVWPSAYAQDGRGSYELDFGCDSLAGPDLQAAQPVLSATTLRPGQVLAVETEIVNQGNESSQNTAVQFILAGNPTVSDSDRVLGRADVPPLQPNVTSQESMAFVVDALPGTYWVAACVDAVAQEAETGDNCAMSGPITVEATGRPIDIGAHLNDAWYDPATSGQGFFINVFPNQNQMFVSWFTFDTERPDDDVPFELGDPGHRWLVALGTYERGVAELDVYLNEGGVFDQPEPRPTESVYGSMTVRFSDCNHGQVEFDLPAVNRQGTIPITRVAADNLEDCQAKAGVLESGSGEPLAGMGAAVPGASAAFAINPGLNDAWYNPATSGQGFAFNVFPQLGAVFMSWFTFDTELPPDDVDAELGAPGLRWLTAVGKVDGDSADLTLYRVAGGVFNSAEPSPEESEYGTVALRFDDCRSGELQYDIPSLSRQGTVPLRRLVPDSAPACEQAQLRRQQDLLVASPTDKAVLENFCGGSAAWSFDWPEVPHASGYTLELWRNDALRPMTFAVNDSEFRFEKTTAVPEGHRAGWKWRYRAEYSASGTSAAFTPFFSFDVAACGQ